ncbi:Uncharacterised protein [Bordetella pertussis]|nr:Uncharacterised protein [Bordetella pertussis]CPJ90664.1 Uncharacterised protein [Bordetella pertussis]CPM27881.1 Uncharacterised protein [Bordetella pertussis]CPN49774.1 Uncharacterised protein [Bordetella pertussis]
MGPHGTLAASSRDTHSCMVRACMAWAMMGISVSRLRLRCAMVEKRLSVASCGMPINPANVTNWVSLPTATITSPSLQRNTWYGTMLECVLPSRCGILPDRK